MSTILSPVVLFVYNRLQYTKNVLFSLEQNPLCPKSHIYIFADAKGRKSKTSDVTAVHNFLDTYKESSLFKKVTIIIAKEHKGLAVSVISGVTHIINHYGKAIVLEDDLIVSKDFLQYMNDSLNFYEHNNKIWSISGHTPALPCLKSNAQGLYLAYRASSWGWATWKDRWNSTDWSVKDYLVFKHNIVKQYRFNRGGNDLSEMLKNQMEGRTDSWAVRWCYSQCRQNKYTIYPMSTKVKNCGLDGSGTHCARSKDSPEIFPMEQKCTFIQLKPNRTIISEFKKHYGPDNLKWLIIFLKLDHISYLLSKK